MVVDGKDIGQRQRLFSSGMLRDTGMVREVKNVEFARPHRPHHSNYRLMRTQPPPQRHHLITMFGLISKQSVRRASHKMPRQYFKRSFFMEDQSSFDVDWDEQQERGSWYTKVKIPGSSWNHGSVSYSMNSNGMFIQLVLAFKIVDQSR